MLLNLSSKKTTNVSDILVKILKANIDIYLKDLTALTNDCLEKGVFPNELKLADASSVFKKGESLSKKNYRPVSILFHMTKVLKSIS